MAQQHHWDFSTRAVHVGNEVDKETGAIRRPITMANSYALPYDPTDMVKRVDVYRNYELNVELNMNIRQFFLGMDEIENIPITA